MKTKPEKRVSYPWDEWIKQARQKKGRKLRYCYDFWCNPWVMAQQIRNVATRRGLKVTVDVQSVAVIFKVLGKIKCR